MGKRIIVVHGRSTKPKREEKEALVREALLHGLGRVSAESRARLAAGEVAVELAYYGDINNAILYGYHARPRKPFRRDFLTAWEWEPVPGARYAAPMQKLFAVGQQNKKNYHALNRRYRDFRYVDDVLDVISPFAHLFGLNDNVLNALLPDLSAYFRYRTVGSMVRDRLQRVLLPALDSGDEICLVTHSMGTIVAYDVLWKLSHMSEYRDYRDKAIALLLTLGSPLGEPGIRQQLYDAHEPADGRYPRNIRRWHNFSAADDYVARDEALADNFREMAERRYVGGVQDHAIYNFWVGENDTTNPHKLYGYLDNKKVCSVIDRWLNA
jgi:hypothetical protein